MIVVASDQICCEKVIKKSPMDAYRQTRKRIKRNCRDSTQAAFFVSVGNQRTVQDETVFDRCLSYAAISVLSHVSKMEMTPVFMAACVRK